MDAESAANAMNELDPHVKKTLTNYLDPQIFLNIIQKMPSDEIVDILKDMPEEQAKIVLEKIKDGKTKKIEKLINYPNDKAGGIMSVDYFTALIDDTVAQTVEKIKKVSPSLRSLIYGYVVDEENKFYGIVSMRTLLISPPDYKIKKVFSHIPKRSTLDPHDDLTKIVNIMTKYDLYTVAVVDETKKLLGIIFIDDVMRRLVPHA
jgi:Mg/Co/Ni transporter MgtE